MSETSETTETPETMSDELTMQLARILRHGLGNSLNLPNSQPTSELSEIAFKLKGENYPLWAILMKKEILGRGLISHVTGVPRPPPETDPTFNKWEQIDSRVFPWILKNLDPSLINGVSQYPTSKELWDGLATMFGSGTDSLQVFDLHRRANRMKQGDKTVEELWYKFQELWMTIDRRQPNPMKCKEDLEIYNDFIQTNRLYQFLTSLDRKYEQTIKEILKMDPLPTVTRAYAMIRRETSTDEVLQPESAEGNGQSGSGGGIGTGLAVKDRGRSAPTQSHPPSHQSQYQHRRNWSQTNRRDEEDKNKLTCTHCGGKRHTKEQCFHLIGFPDWWDDYKQSRTANRKATAAIGGEATRGTTSVPRSVTGNPGGSHGEGNRGGAAEKREEEGFVAKAAAFVEEGEGGNPKIKGGVQPLHLKPPKGDISDSRPSIFRKYQKKTPNFKKYISEPPDLRNIKRDPIIKCSNQFEVLGEIYGVCAVTGEENKDPKWIFDCGATDTMSFDVSDQNKSIKKISRPDGQW